MAKVTPISEHFQHFLAEMKETFWGDLYGQTKLAWQRFFELQSERQRDRFSGAERYERRRGRRRVYRNGYYERDFVTRFGTIRLRIARTREKSFLPCGLQRFQRRAEEVSMLIREAFLRGISTRQVGRVVATLTGEVVSARTVVTAQPADNSSGGATSAPVPAAAGPVHEPQPENALAPIVPPPPPVDAAPASPRTIALGQTIDQVLATFGQPQKVVNLGTREVYYYSDMKVTFVKGKVTDVQ